MNSRPKNLIPFGLHVFDDRGGIHCLNAKHEYFRIIFITGIYEHAQYGDLAPAENGADISEATGDMIGFDFDLGAWKMGSCQLDERMQQIGFCHNADKLPVFYDREAADFVFEKIADISSAKSSG